MRASIDIPVGTREIARLAAVAPDTVDEWRRRHPSFPIPLWTVSGRPAWRLGDVVDWLRATGRWPTRVVAAAMEHDELDGRPVEAWNARLGVVTVAALELAGAIRRDDHWTGTLVWTDAAVRARRHIGFAPSTLSGRDGPGMTEQQWQVLRAALAQHLT